MLLVAVVLAVSAGLLAQNWLQQQSLQARQQPNAPTPSNTTTKIVVANAPLRFGTVLSANNVTEVDWPTRTLPAGVFTSRAELFKAAERRVVLAAIEQHEPILSTKITGPGQRATVSSLIQDGKRAVTIRVNDVHGVAGFVLPGDRVDVLRTQVENAQQGTGKTFTDVLLQNIKVLGIDQQADERAEKSTVVKAVTLEVDTEEAQKLVLAQTVGILALMLRQAGSQAMARTERVTVDDLGRRIGIITGSITPAEPAAAPPRERRTGVVNVTRGTKKSDYSVSVESD